MSLGSPMIRFLLIVAALVVVPGFAGCDGGRAKLMEDLKYTGMAYHNYIDEKQAGPPDWEELIRCAQFYGITGEHIRRVRDAGYEMKWNVKLADIKEPTSTVVLAKPP